MKALAVTLAVMTLLFILISFYFIIQVVQPLSKNQSTNRQYNTSQDSQPNFLIQNPFSYKPSCGTNNTFFTVSPIALSDFTNIVPLGNPNPPDHIFPTDHIYIYVKRSGPASQSGALAPPAEVTVFSPGNITIIRINSKEYLASSLLHNFQPHIDYQMDFSPCKEFVGRFDHIASLSDKIKSQYTTSDSCTTFSTGSTTIKSCMQSVSIDLNAGDIIGTAGGQNGSNALDFGAIDYRTTPLLYSNPSRWGLNSLYAVCPLDYFTSNLQSVLKAKLGDFQGNLRTIQPICGEVDQDVANTTQGVWFVKGTTQTYPEYLHLALVHDNIDPSKEVFSVGASMNASGLSPSAYYFVPTASGLVNRDFKDITNDGKVYCFQVDNKFGGSTSVIILQLTSSTTLRIEKLNTINCGNGLWTFDSSATDFER